jgi:hypothetical protein
LNRILFCHIFSKDGGMLIMDASVSGAKARHAEAVPARQSIVLPPDVPVSKPPKALAPQVVSDLQADEAPMKPVFVKRDKRETRVTDSAASNESNKRTFEAALAGSHSKKPLCSFDDE